MRGSNSERLRDALSACPSWTVHVGPANHACPATGLVFPFSVEGAVDARRALERTREKCPPEIGVWYILQMSAHVVPSRVADVLPACTTRCPAGYEEHIGETGYSHLGGADRGEHACFRRRVLVNDRRDAVGMYGDHETFPPRVKSPAQIASNACGRVRPFGVRAASLEVERFVESVDIALEQQKHSRCH